MEVRLNEGVDVYRELYFEGGTGSAYLWGLEDGFAGVVLLKKGGGKAGQAGWDSIHVLEVVERGRTARYKLTSTVILGLGMKTEALGSVDLSGNMTRQVEQELAVEGGDDGHVMNIGRMVEDMESKMRNLLQEVYFGKAKDVVGDLRSEFSRPYSFRIEANNHDRHTSDLRNEQRPGTAKGDDQQHAAIDNIV